MKDEFERNSAELGKSGSPSPTPREYPVIRIDVALYESYLADSDLTDDQKQEFLAALWSIIVGFVDLGFGIDPVGQTHAGDPCGQILGPEMSGPENQVSSSNEAVTPDVPSLRKHMPSSPKRKGGTT